jgi:sulfane dehydrogenase subunit SoxC
MSFKMEPQGFLRRIPLEPHRLTEQVTPARDVIVLCHLGVPHIAANEWSLTVDGMVAREKRFDLALLRRYSEVEIESVHECAGSPLQPEMPARRTSNVVWRGIRLADLLDDCAVDGGAAYIWPQGADHGEFHGVRVPAYVKDLPLDRIGDDVLIATGLNGAPLPRENGFPARLAVPGFYGTNSVKWLTRLTLAATRADSPFTTTWYNDPVRDGGPAAGTVPVWALAPHSVIVSPAPGDKLTTGFETVIWGWAWADKAIESVRVTANGGVDWFEARVAERQGRGWQRFIAMFTPTQTGPLALASCAFTANGVCQPRTGARNAWYEVLVNAV